MMHTTNIVGGLTLEEPAADLSAVPQVAIASGYLDKPRSPAIWPPSERWSCLGNAGLSIAWKPVVLSA
ncbi:MAG: hypothetical protein ACLU38_09330 [Dysosmobacter sp.]